MSTGAVSNLAAELYVTFTPIFDEGFQQTSVSVRFHPALVDETAIDVSFLLSATGTSRPRHEGAIVDAAGSARFGDEHECVDRWPGDGDWFYSWEDLLDAYKDQWVDIAPAQLLGNSANER